MPDRPQGYLPLPNSELSPLPGFVRDPAPVDLDQELLVTIRVRRRADAPGLPDPECAEPSRVTGRKFISREDLAKRYGADGADIKR
jgi:hypothetical protein